MNSALDIITRLKELTDLTGGIDVVDIGDGVERNDGSIQGSLTKRGVGMVGVGIELRRFNKDIELRDRILRFVYEGKDGILRDIDRCPRQTPALRPLG